MDEMVEKLCHIGNEANKLYTSGFFSEAERKYFEILSSLEQSKKIDSYIVSKAVLGLLLTSIKSQNFERAITLWTNHGENSIFAVGISGLENAQTSVHDMFIYDFICAYLHSVSVNKPGESAKAVNLYMSRVCQHAFEIKDQKMIRLALSNWKQHLREVFDRPVPHDYAAELIRFEKKYGEVVPLMTIDFPKLTSWEKPNDFREMSRFIDIDEKKLKSLGLNIGFDVGAKSGSAARKMKTK